MNDINGLNLQSNSQSITEEIKISKRAIAELKTSVYAALETYSNVHRGSGHFSLATTHLYEKAREIVLEYLELDKVKSTVIFSTPARAAHLLKQLNDGVYISISSNEMGLPLGVVAIGVDKNSLPKGVPFETGGGTTTLIAREWVDWAKVPDKFEAGTPAIINVIVFAKALMLVKKFGCDIFKTDSQTDTIFNLLYDDELKEFTGKELYHKLQESVIGNNINVPTTFGLHPFVNLDHSASTPSTTLVWETFNKVLFQSENTKVQLKDEVKSIIGSFTNAPDSLYDISFTSNTTEAINVIARNVFKDADIEPVVVNSIMEHSSNELPWRYSAGCSMIRLDIDESGYLKLDVLENLLKEYNELKKYGRKRISLIAITGASNVLGTCNETSKLSDLAKRYNAMLLIDAAQLIAHKKIDMEASGIDFLVFSGHKIYAPFGTGVLISRKGLLDYNAESIKSSVESGEQNIGGIAALGKSLLLLQRVGMEVVQEEESHLCVKALKEMAEIPNMKLFGITDPKSNDFKDKISVIPFTSTKMFGDKIAYQLAAFGGIGIRFGCHCAHIIVKRLVNLNPFLERVQRMIIRLFPNMKLPGVARASIGLATTEKDVDHFISTLKLIYSKDKALLAKMPEAQQQIDEFIKEREQLVYSE